MQCDVGLCLVAIAAVTTVCSHYVIRRALCRRLPELTAAMSATSPTASKTLIGAGATAVTGATTSVWNKKKSRWESVPVDPSVPAPEKPRGKVTKVGALVHPLGKTDALSDTFTTTTSLQFTGSYFDPAFL
jgi:hypothetical protein